MMSVRLVLHAFLHYFQWTMDRFLNTKLCFFWKKDHSCWSEMQKCNVPVFKTSQNILATTEKCFSKYLKHSSTMAVTFALTGIIYFQISFIHWFIHLLWLTYSYLYILLNVMSYTVLLISDFVINTHSSFASTFVRLKEVFLTLYWNHI